jgi:WD40 repeat protein
MSLIITVVSIGLNGISLGGGDARYFLGGGILEDNRTVVALGDDGTVRSWDWKKDVDVQVPNMSRRMGSMLLSKNGSKLVAFGPGMLIMDMKSKKVMREFGAYAVNKEASISDDGELLMLPFVDDTKPPTAVLDVMNVKNGTRRKIAAFGPRAITCTRLNEAGTKCACGFVDGTVVVVDTENGKVIAEFRGGHRGRVSALAFSSDSRIVASGSEDEQVIIWEVGNTKPINTMRNHRGTVTAVAFSARHKCLFSLSTMNGPFQWDSASYKLLKSYHEDCHGGSTLFLGADDSNLLVLSAAASVFDIETGVERARLELQKVCLDGNNKGGTVGWLIAGNVDSDHPVDAVGRPRESNGCCVGTGSCCGGRPSPR